MTAPDANPKVFLAYARSDQNAADEMRKLLEAAGVEVLSVPDNSAAGSAALPDVLRSAINSATVVFALIGPKTRASKWIDLEIELALQAAPESRPAALVAVILKDHEDYTKPFYDPANVPLRIHDHVSRESAILRKWPQDPAEVRQWIAEALRRRQRFPTPFINFSTQTALIQFDWDPAADQPPPERK